MKQLAKRKLGNSNLLVSRMAMGTVPLSGLGARTTYDDFEETILAAPDEGGSISTQHLATGTGEQNIF
ncbi:hypothetical protein [Paraburkholderia elongata]|uniref:Uncharacterized protein n=1 Tax=Paraburkholderia elongata TaxID=2675747 RepID=A0A972NK57_9BURK|nr:hypothetical protein [Paraburkholderia elongata]NPT53075.1 hypothetical protein [Paraburkholderia elongata]